MSKLELKMAALMKHSHSAWLAALQKERSPQSREARCVKSTHALNRALLWGGRTDACDPKYGKGRIDYELTPKPVPDERFSRERNSDHYLTLAVMTFTIYLFKKKAKGPRPGRGGRALGLLWVCNADRRLVAKYCKRGIILPLRSPRRPRPRPGLSS